VLTVVNLAVVCITIGVAAFLASRFHPKLKNTFKPDEKTFSIDILIRQNPALAVAIMTAATLIAFMIYKSMLLIPIERDSIAYHIPKAIRWLQSGSLWEKDFLFWSYPANSELILAWFLIPLQSELLINIQNLPIAFLGIVAVYSFIIQMNCSKPTALYGALLYATMPTVATQFFLQTNDIYFPALVFASMALFKHYETSHRLRYAILAATALGLLLGVKYNALYYVLFIGLIFWITNISKFRFSFILMVIPIIVFGGFWYARNWIIGSSPFYPIGIEGSSGGGYLLTSISAHLSNPQMWRDFIECLAPFGGVSALLAIPVWIVLIITMRRSFSAKFFYINLIVIPAIFFLFVFITPYTAASHAGSLLFVRLGYPVRLALPFWVYSIVFLCLLLDRVKYYQGAEAVFLLAIFLNCDRHWILSAPFVLFLTAGVLVLLIHSGVIPIPKRFFSLKCLGPVLIVLFIAASPFLKSLRDREYVEKFRVDCLGSDPARQAVVIGWCFSPYAGPDFKTNVSLSLDAKDPIGDLMRRNIDVIVFLPDNDRPFESASEPIFEKALAMLKSHPELFRQTCAERNIKAFRVIKHLEKS